MRARWGYWFLAASLVIAACLGALVVWRLSAGKTPTPPLAKPSSVTTPIETAAPAPKAAVISTMIDLPGDPVQVSRGTAGAPRASHVSLPSKIGASAPKVELEAYYIAVPLVANDGGYMGKFPEGGGEADSLAEQIALNTALMAQAASGSDSQFASDDDGGDLTASFGPMTLVTKDNSNVLDAAIAPDGEPQLKQTTIKAVVAQKISDVVEADGFTRESAEAVEAAVKSAFGVSNLTPGSLALLAGAREPAGGYRAAQFALFQEGEYVGTVALSDNGLMAEAARPSLPDGFLDASDAGAVSPQRFTLADGIYSAGLRAGAPEPVVREAIGMVGSLTDLHQPLRADQSLRVLYARDPRVKATGGGRIIYVGLSGGPGPVDCYAAEGADQLFRCFGAKGPASDAKGPPSGANAIIVQTGASSVGGILAPIKGAPVTSLFGMRFHPILHILRLHAGIDFGAPIGSPVRASADGVIEIAGPVSGFGNHIRIKHDGFETSVSHLSEIPEAIKPGVAVKEGEVIALSGNTGLSTGPHLHFEYYLGGSAVDPLPHMGTEVRGNIAAGAGEGLVNGAGNAAVPLAGPGPTTGPSEAEVAGFPAFKALVDGALSRAVGERDGASPKP